MLGLSGFYPKFVKKYTNLKKIIEKAVKKYSKEVKRRSFQENKLFIWKIIQIKLPSYKILKSFLLKKKKNYYILLSLIIYLINWFEFLNIYKEKKNKKLFQNNIYKRDFF